MPSPRLSPTAHSKTSSSKSSSKKAAAAFSKAVAAKDNNRLHNLPEDLQITIMTMARQKKKNSQSKTELHKKIYYNRELFVEWLDEIKRNGVDDKNRVRNPLRKGSMIYTDKKGLYSKLWNLCATIFQGNYNFNNGKIPRPIKIDYKQQSKFFYKPE